MSRTPAVVFDLDGTLIDSRPDLVCAINQMRRELDLAPLEVSAVERMVGEGARLLVRRALGGDPDPELLERSHARFLAIYAECCTDRTSPYPGIPELVEALGATRRIALLTNKPEAMTRTILARFGWESAFRVVVGGDTLAFRKPDGRGLLWIADELRVQSEDLLLVGDSRIDAEAAAAAGVPFLWVSWGYAAPEDREQLATGNRAETVAELAGKLGIGGQGHGSASVSVCGAEGGLS